MPTKATALPTAAACERCGSTDIFVEREDLSAYQTICNNCQSRGPIVEAAKYYDDENAGQRDAIIAWNRRASTDSAPAAQPARIEELSILLTAARSLPSLKGITLTSKDPMAQARWLSALGDLQKAVAAYDAAPVLAPQTMDELAAKTAASLFDGTILTESRLAEAIAAAIRQHTEAAEMIYPEEMTPALLDALGYLNFQTGPIARALRAAGADIPRKCEAEQAHVLHWFIRLALQHGDGWQEAARDEVQRIAKAVKSGS